MTNRDRDSEHEIHRFVSFSRKKHNTGVCESEGKFDARDYQRMKKTGGKELADLLADMYIIYKKGPMKYFDGNPGVRTDGERTIQFSFTHNNLFKIIVFDLTPWYRPGPKYVGVSDHMSTLVHLCGNKTDLLKGFKMLLDAIERDI